MQGIGPSWEVWDRHVYLPIPSPTSSAFQVDVSRTGWRTPKYASKRSSTFPLQLELVETAFFPNNPMKQFEPTDTPWDHQFVSHSSPHQLQWNNSRFPFNGQARMGKKIHLIVLNTKWYLIHFNTHIPYSAAYGSYGARIICLHGSPTYPPSKVSHS